MKIKRYKGRSLKDAMNQAKAELGEEVKILETHNILTKDPNSNPDEIVEITVIAGQDELKNQNFKNPLMRDIQGNKISKPFYDHLPKTITQQSDGLMPGKELVDEISYLRRDLEKLNGRLRNMTKQDFPGPFTDIYDKLLEIGFPVENATAYIRHAIIRLDYEKKVTSQKILKSIKQEIGAVFDDAETKKRKIRSKQKIVALVGSTGVGKTTMIMKMALHPEIHGNKKVAVITTDTYRPAASELLKALTRIASIPVFEVKDVSEINNLMKKLKSYEVILIDTPGRSPFFPNYIKELQDYLYAFQPTDIQLALSMTADLDDLMLSAGIYLSLKPNAVVFTKFDETSRPGKVVAIMQELQLPALFLSNGQTIPNDIYRINGEFITNKILEII